MARRGHDVTFSFDPRGPVGARLDGGITPVPVTIRGDADPAAILALWRRIRLARPDVVCVNTSRELRVGGVAARLARVGTVVNRRGASDALRDGFVDRVVVRVLVDVLVRDSDFGVRLVRERNPWYHGPALRARNGIDVDSVGSVMAAPRESFGARPGEVVVAMTDRRRGSPGCPDVARALARVRASASMPPLRLVVLGTVGGDAEAEVRRVVSQVEGLEVVFPGHLGETQTLAALAAADVYARVAWSDGVPFAVLEAMALGRPVVATATGGVPEVVVHEVTGLLVEPGDVDGLAAALGRVCADAGLRARMGEAGRRRVRDEFGEERMLDEYEAAFRIAAGRRE